MDEYINIINYLWFKGSAYTHVDAARYIVETAALDLTHTVRVRTKTNGIPHCKETDLQSNAPPPCHQSMIHYIALIQLLKTFQFLYPQRLPDDQVPLITMQYRA